MKKPFRLAFLISAFFILVAVLIAETLIVKVQSTNLRKEPKFYAPTVAVLVVGENLETLSSQGGWIKVRTSGGLTGWIHSSSVKPKKFSLFAMDKSLKTQTTADEVALASKGFSKEIEEKYKEKHGELSFAWVERMLQIKVSPSRLENFLKKGKLGEFGGEK